MLETFQIKTGNYFLEGNTYTSYGIQCNDLVIEDISLDKAAIACLVERCNFGKLNPIHLFDVVEDFLAAFDSTSCRASCKQN